MNSENKNEMRDSKRMTEEEFLEDYKKHAYPAPYLTADMVIFRKKDEGYELLLIRRKNHPFIGMRAVPGGFVTKGESAEEAAARELAEETHVEGIPLSHLRLYSSPDRDPRGWIVTEGFFAVCGSSVEASADDDASDAVWFRVEEKSCRMGAGTGSLHLRLTAGEETLELQAETAKNPYTDQWAVSAMHANAIATDHGQMICDAWLAIRKA